MISPFKIVKNIEKPKSKFEKVLNTFDLSDYEHYSFAVVWLYFIRRLVTSLLNPKQSNNNPFGLLSQVLS